MYIIGNAFNTKYKYMTSLVAKKKIQKEKEKTLYAKTYKT